MATGDEWSTDGDRVDAQLVQRLREMIERESTVVVEHRFYRGARAPHRFVCNDIAELERYLSCGVTPGDSFYFWHFERCCRDDNVLERGKMPDEHRRVPKRGAY
ncbi:MAG TPA: hypothetical protein VGG74_09550 [Kofleriaceae bacterium]|jgi:hypothetical protein